MYTWLSLMQVAIKSDDANPTAPAVTNGNAYLMEVLPQIEEWIESVCDQSFAPKVETKFLDVEQNVVDVNNDQLILPRPFLEITTVTVDDIAQVLWDYTANNRATSNYFPYPRGETPTYILQGMNSMGRTWIPSDVTHFVQSIMVQGITGYRRGYPSEGWQLSGDKVLNDPLAIDDTSITVEAADGEAFDGSSPRFSEGMLIQCELEMMLITKVADNTTLKVRRAVRGSTAAEHVLNTPIEVWYPEPEIMRAAAQFAAYMYKRRANYEILKINAGNAGQTITQTPSVMPEAVREILSHFRNPNAQLFAP